MPDPMPTVVIPGLICSARLYAGQIPELWRFGPVMVADHTRDDTMGRSPGAYSAPRRRVLRWSACRWADTSPLRSCASSPDGSRASHCSTRRRARTARSNPRSATRALRPPRPGDLARWSRSSIRGGSIRHASKMRRCARRYVGWRMTSVPTHSCASSARSRAAPRAGLAAIRCPTLVLVGDSDAGTPPELAREVAAGIAGSRLVVVPDCGHLSTLERPQAVAAALVEWRGALDG
jgi:pimeloyl-ACP methyl ester carboxylesterase